MRKKKSRWSAWNIGIESQFAWPEIEDISWFETDSVVCLIEPPIPISSRTFGISQNDLITSRNIWIENNLHLFLIYLNQFHHWVPSGRVFVQLAHCIYSCFKICYILICLHLNFFPLNTSVLNTSFEAKFFLKTFDKIKISSQIKICCQNHFRFQRIYIHMFETSLTEVVFLYRFFSLHFFSKKRLSEIDGLIFL